MPDGGGRRGGGALPADPRRRPRCLQARVKYHRRGRLPDGRAALPAAGDAHTMHGSGITRVRCTPTVPGCTPTGSAHLWSALRSAPVRSGQGPPLLVTEVRGCRAQQWLLSGSVRTQPRWEVGSIRRRQAGITVGWMAARTDNIQITPVLDDSIIATFVATRPETF